MIINRVISGYAYNIIKRILPKISETEKAALNSGSVSIDGDIFNGNLDISRIVSKYKISLKDEEKAFLNKETNELCNMINNDEIEKNQNLSNDTWDYIRKNNFMGLVIPKQFNGKGFSPHAHSLIVEKIAGRNIAAAVSVMVPNSLGPGELLYHYGTDEQKNYYLPKLADGSHIPCFGLTTETSGSDAASMNDCGIVVKENGILGIRITFSKRYITLAPVASLIGLAFKLSDPNKLLTTGKEGITVVLLEKENYKGIEIGNRHNPLNIGFMNGTIRGTDIFVPMSCVIGGEDKCGLGWNMLMESLGEGRGISLPAMSIATAKLCTMGVGGYARIRKQFNIPIAEMEGIKEKLAIIAGINYKLLAAQSLFNAILEKNEKPPVLSAIMKYKFTEYGRITVNNGMDIMGGAGICKGSMNFLASNYVATPVAITVEGSNTLTRSLIIFGQGLNRSHPHLLNIISSIENNDKKGFSEHFTKIIYHTFNNLVKSVYYGIYLKIYRNKNDISRYHEVQLNRHVANFAFIANMGLLMGGKIKTAEYISGRYADILSDIYMSYACLWYYRQNKEIKDIDKLLSYSLNDYYYNIENNIYGISYNFPITIIGKLMKIITFPLGKQYRENDDKLTTIVSNIISTPTELRKVLTNNMYISNDEEDRIRQISDGFELCYEVDKSIKNGSEYDILKLNKSKDLREKIIKVNEYKKDGL
jgi:acyl-CoA dehydrogenase